MANETQNPDQTKIDALNKKLRRYNIIALASLIMCIALLIGSINVVLEASTKSMIAFEQLPQYKVNLVSIAYRNAVKKIDESFAATSQMIAGEEAQQVVNSSRSLVSNMITGEEEFGSIIQHYANALDTASAQTGGLAEWNRHFQMEMAQLKQSSLNRKAAMEATLNEFPPISEEKTEVSG